MPFARAQRSYDAAVDTLAKHLPGRHNQQDHAGRSGSRFGTGEGGLLAGDAEVVGRLSDRQYVKPGSLKKTRMTSDTGLTGTVYETKLPSGAKVQVHIGDGTRDYAGDMLDREWGDSDAEDICEAVARMDALNPLAGKRKQTVVVAMQRDSGRGYAGSVKTNTTKPHLTLYANGVYRSGGPSLGLRPPSTDVVGIRDGHGVQHVVAHEYGHLHDFSLAQRGGFRSVLSKERTAVQAARGADRVSDYAGTNGHEAYAEAFADHVLTKGGSRNGLVRALADLHGWSHP